MCIASFLDRSSISTLLWGIASWVVDAPFCFFNFVNFLRIAIIVDFVIADVTGNYLVVVGFVVATLFTSIL